MIQGRKDSRLAFEACEALWIHREGFRQELDGDIAPESRVARAIHFAHPADTEQAHDFVRAEASAGRKRQRRSRCTCWRLL